MGIDLRFIVSVLPLLNSHIISEDLNGMNDGQNLSVCMKDETTYIKLRLFLVRHGETEDNYKGICVGQADSPLTNIGIRQAKALGETPIIRKTPFWRRYSSDLNRTRRTIIAVLNLDCENTSDDVTKHYSSESSDITMLKNSGVRLDKKLREIAKGARQGFPRSMSLEEAICERKRQGISSDYPHLETTDEAWNRISTWLCEVMLDATKEALGISDSDLCTLHEQSIENVVSDQQLPNALNVLCPPHKFDILVVGHSGIFRILLTNILGDNCLRNHPDAIYGKEDGKLLIPNTSVTILDIKIPIIPSAIPIMQYNRTVDRVQAFLDQRESRDNYKFGAPVEGLGITVDIVQLTSTEHLKYI